MSKSSDLKVALLDQNPTHRLTCILSLYLQGSLHFPVGGILSCLLTISNSANGHHFAQEEAQVERQNGFAKCFDTKKMEAGNEKLLKVGGRFVRCLFKNQVCCS